MADKKFTTKIDPNAGVNSPYPIDDQGVQAMANQQFKAEAFGGSLAPMNTPVPSMGNTNLLSKYSPGVLAKANELGYSPDLIEEATKMFKIKPENITKQFANNNIPLAGFDAVMPAPTKEQQKNIDMRTSIDMGLKDYIERQTGQKADLDTVVRKLSFLGYKDPLTYENKAREAVNQMIRNGDAFDLASEIGNKVANQVVGDIQKVDPSFGNSPAVYPFRKPVMDFTEGAVAGFRNTEALASWLSPDVGYKPTNFSGKLGQMGGVVGGFMIDLLPIGKALQVMKIPEYLRFATSSITKAMPIIGTTKTVQTIGMGISSILYKGLEFAVQGQLTNPETWAEKNRLKKFGHDFEFGSILAIGGIASKGLAGLLPVSERISMPALMGGFGYGLAKMEGSNEEDAIVNAVGFAMLEMAGTVTDKKVERKDKSVQDKIDVATKDLMDLVGGDQEAFKSLMQKYQDTRSQIVNGMEGAVPGFWDTPSGKELMDQYTSGKRGKDLQALASKAIDEVKAGKVAEDNRYQLGKAEGVMGKGDRDMPDISLPEGVKNFQYTVKGDTLKIDHIEVSSKVRGTGIGTEAMSRIETWAKDSGIKRIEIDAYKKSTGFWEKQGFNLDKDFPVVQVGNKLVKQDFKPGYKDLAPRAETETKTVNPQMFFRDPEFKNYYLNGSDAGAKSGGEIILDKDGKLVSGYEKASEALKSGQKNIQIQVPSIGRIEKPSVESNAGTNTRPQTPAEKFEGFSDITTRTLENLKGKDRVSYQFVENFLKTPEMKKQEKEVISEVLKEYSPNEKINVKEFADKVKKNLLDIKLKELDRTEWDDCTLPEQYLDNIGSIDEYVEIIHEVPFETGKSHFAEDNYFGHSRVQIIDMQGEQYALVNEIQNDVMQFSGDYKKYRNISPKFKYEDTIKTKTNEIASLKNTVGRYEEQLKSLEKEQNEDYIESEKGRLTRLLETEQANLKNAEGALAEAKAKAEKYPQNIIDNLEAESKKTKEDIVTWDRIKDWSSRGEENKPSPNEQAYFGVWEKVRNLEKVIEQKRWTKETDENAPEIEANFEKADRAVNEAFDNLGIEVNDDVKSVIIGQLKRVYDWNAGVSGMKMDEELKITARDRVDRKKEDLAKTEKELNFYKSGDFKYRDAKLEEHDSIWHERQIRDVIKWAKDRGLKGVMFPDGKTVAFVERWVGERQGISEDAEAGETVELWGEDYVVLNKRSDSAEVVRADEIDRDYSLDDLRSDELDNQRSYYEDDWNYFKEEFADKFVEKIEENDLYDDFKTYLEEEGKDYDNLSDVEKVDEFENFTINNTSPYSKIKEEVIYEKAEEWADETFGDAYSAVSYYEDIYGRNNVVADENDRIYFLKERNDGVRDVEIGNSSEDLEKSYDEIYDEMDNNQQGVMYFYENIVDKYLKKLRKDTYDWEDPNGLNWYRIDFNEKDTEGQPVYAYQKVENAKRESTISLEEAKKIVYNYFDPSEVTIRNFDFITSPEGYKAFGRYLNATIDFAKDPISSTPHHEAFHAYFDMFSAPAEKLEALKYVKEKWGAKNNVEAEEMLADKFVEFVREKDPNKNIENFGTALVNYFQKIWENIKTMFSEEYRIKKLFGDVVKKRRRYINAKYEVISKFSESGQIQKFTGFEDLTTGIVEQLKGKTDVSKQFLLNLTMSDKFKKSEKEVIRNTLAKFDGEKVNASEFAEAVKLELMPLVRVSAGRKWENVSLPDNLKGNVDNYEVAIYEAPFKTSAGGVHFGGYTDNYFAHIRYEDLGDTRRIIEVQSDLFQRGRYENESTIMQAENTISDLSKINEGRVKEISDYQKVIDLIGEGKLDKYIGTNLRGGSADNTELRNFLEKEGIGKKVTQLAFHAGYTENRGAFISKIEDWINETRNEYKKDQADIDNAKNIKDNTEASPEEMRKYNFLKAYKEAWYERVIREEIKRAGQDGKKKLVLPTGETIARIEGYIGSSYVPEDAKIGDTFDYAGEDYRIIEDNGDTVTALPSNSIEREFDYMTARDEDYMYRLDYFDLKEDWAMEELKTKFIEKYGEEEWKTIEDRLSNDEDIHDIRNEDDRIMEVESEIIEDQINYDYKDAEGMVKYYNRELGRNDGEYVLLGEDQIGYAKSTDYKEEFTKGNLEEYNREDLSEDQQAVVDFYDKEIKKAFNKNRRDMKVVKDERGVEWYEASVTPEDGKQPVYAYQKTNIDKDLAEWREIKKQVQDTPQFEDNLSDLFGKLVDVEQRIKSKIDPKQYITNQKNEMISYLKEYVKDAFQWQDRTGMSKINKQIDTQWALDYFKDDFVMKYIEQFADMKGVGVGGLMDKLTKVSKKETVNWSQLADFVLKNEDDLYSFLAREAEKENPAPERKSNKPKDILADLKEQKRQKEIQDKVAKLDAKQKKAINKVSSEYKYQAKKQEVMNAMEGTEPVDRELLDQIYDDVATKINGEGGIIKNISKKIVKAYDLTRLFGAKTLMPISTRLKRISFDLYDRFKTMEYNSTRLANEDIDMLEGFFLAIEKLDKTDKTKFDLALKNRDEVMIKKLVQENGFESEYNKARKVLENLYNDAKEAGIDVAYLENYYPRMVKDLDGLMKYLHNTDSWGVFDNALKAEAKKAGKKIEELTPEEKAMIINNVIRGYGEQLKLSSSGNLVKGRGIKYIDATLNEFYHGPSHALSSYITYVRENIEARKFFGKQDPTNSIGSFVADLVTKGEIKAEQQQELVDILKSYFNKARSNDLLKWTKNATYAMTIANPKSALTNLEDLAISLHEGGVINTIKAMTKAFANKSDVSVKDLGFEKLYAEFMDTKGMSATFLENLLKYSGFAKLDRTMKETTINAYYQRITQQAKADDPKLFDEISKYVRGDKYKKAVEDLKAGVSSPEVMEVLYRKMSALQPVTLGEMSETYLKSSGSRLFYALKTFQMKRIDYYVNDAFKSRTPVEFARKLVMLSMYMYLVGFSVDEIKNVLLLRQQKPSDLSTDQFLKIVGITKYQIYQAKINGPAQAFWNFLMPSPLSIGGTVLQGKGDSYIPYIGPFYSWWFGSGRDSTNKRLEKEAKQERKSAMQIRREERAKAKSAKTRARNSK